MIINPYRFQSGGGAVSLRDAILADGPAFYYRMAEASGTVAANETGGASGTYSSVSLNQPPIYAGGPVCARLNMGTANMEVPATLLTSAPALTLMCVLKPQAVTGVQSIITRDPSSPRYWQWRLNGTALEWVKIVGGITTVTAAGTVALNAAAILHVVVNAAGQVSLYKNGALVNSVVTAPANYGSASVPIRVGYDSGPAAGLNAFISEPAGFAAALSAARVLAHAQAAGFA